MDDNADTLGMLRRAVVSDPRNAELRYQLGAEMAQQRDYEGAVLEMSAAIALNPLLHVARLQLGLLHLTMAQPHHTVSVLAPLEDLDDTQAVKFFKRGLEALIRDDFPQCVSCLQQGMALNQENEPLNRDMAMLIDRVREAERDRAASAEPAAEPVRTDFSLYGVTRH